MADKDNLKKGTKVQWNSLNGPTHGKVEKKVDDDKFKVKSDKTGKTAEHKSEALKKR